jgi:hypothetical protein
LYPLLSLLFSKKWDEVPKLARHETTSPNGMKILNCPDEPGVKSAGIQVARESGYLVRLSEDATQ